MQFTPHVLSNCNHNRHFSVFNYDLNIRHDTARSTWAPPVLYKHKGDMRASGVKTEAGNIRHSSLAHMSGSRSTENAEGDRI
jgi:hypothetical protein